MACSGQHQADTRVRGRGLLPIPRWYHDAGIRTVVKFRLRSVVLAPPPTGTPELPFRPRSAGRVPKETVGFMWATPVSEARTAIRESRLAVALARRTQAELTTVPDSRVVIPHRGDGEESAPTDAGGQLDAWPEQAI